MKRTSVQHRLSVLLCVLGLAIPLTQAALHEEFDQPNSYIGSANHREGLDLWFDLGEWELSREEKIPFRILFSSTPLMEGGFLGSHWWCPLLESRLVFESGSAWVSMLGGRGIVVNSWEARVLV